MILAFLVCSVSSILLSGWLQEAEGTTEQDKEAVTEPLSKKQKRGEHQLEDAGAAEQECAVPKDAWVEVERLRLEQHIVYILCL